MKAFLLLVLSSFFYCGLTAQEFSKDETVQDLTWLKERIIEFNAGLSMFTPDFGQKADSLIETINIGSSKYTLYRRVCELAALSNEGHYSLGQSSDSVHYDLYNDLVPFFPMSIKAIGDELYVNYDLTNAGELGRGAQIISINGKTAKTVIDELINCIPTDGKIETYPRRRISENFPWLYYFTMEQPDIFEIEFIPNGSTETRKSSINALKASERKANFTSRYVSSNVEHSIDDFYTLEFLDEISWLTLKSFDWRLIEKYDLDAEDFYKEIFSNIAQKSSNTLVVDLRNNT